MDFSAGMERQAPVIVIRANFFGIFRYFIENKGIHGFCLENFIYVIEK